jgi:hypothetical protein
VAPTKIMRKLCIGVSQYAFWVFQPVFLISALRGGGHNTEAPHVGV